MKLSFPREGKPRKEVHVFGLCNSRAREDLHWAREIKRGLKRNRLRALLGVLRKFVASAYQN